jgi:replicative DNA helicase
MIEDFNVLPGIPPQNTEVEAAILGGCLIDELAFSRVKDLLQPLDFYLQIHQTIYSSMARLDAMDRAIDLMTVATDLADRGELEKIGGQSVLVGLYDSTSNAVNIDLYAELILDKARRRQLINWANQLIKIAHQSHKPEEEIVEEVTLGFNQFLEMGKRSLGELIPIEEVANSGFNELSEMIQEGKTPGIPTGFYDLDSMTGGYRRGSITIVAGRPSMGKSAAAFQQAFNMAKAGYSVAIFSLEMTSESVFFRALSADSGVPSNSILEGRLTDRDWQSLSSAYGPIASLPIYIDDSPVGVHEIQNRIERIQQKTGCKIDAIVIDYVGLMKGVDQDPNREIASISRSLKRLSKKYDAAIILLSQLSRAVESRSDKRPMQSDLRDSGSLEQDACLIIGLYRDEYYNKESMDRGVAELIVLKQRNGPTGTVKMLFEPQYTRFRNMEYRQ